MTILNRAIWRLPPTFTVASFELARCFSVLQRPAPNYDGHVPLTAIERSALAVGSAFMSLVDPRRGGKFSTQLLLQCTDASLDLIALLGETTATPFFIYRLRDAMLSSPTGRRILRDRPRISSKTLSMEKLRKLPENTVGRTYAHWLDREGVSPDTRSQVKYIDNEECAYVMQRYRECHDFYHAMTGLPIIREGEVALKAFEFANTLLPMTGLSMIAVATLKKAERARFWHTYLPWAIDNGSRCKEVINIYWEEELERDVDDLRKELGVDRPPDLRETRRILKEQRKKAQL